MNKLLTKIAKVVLGLSLAAGVGVAIGAKSAQKADAAYNTGTQQTLTFSSGSYANSVITWTTSHLTVVQAQNTGQTAPNSSYVANPRWYSGNKITITPASGFAINGLVITATSSSYATALGGSTFTNASASTSGSNVTVTVTDPSSAVTIVLGGQSRLSTSLTYYYSAAGSDVTQEITGSTTGKVGTPVSLSTNATSTTWSLSNNSAGASLSTTTGKTTSVSATQAGSVTVNAAAVTGYTSASINITFTEPFVSKTFEKITNVSDLEAGLDYLISNAAGTKFMAEQGNNNRSSVAGTVSNNRIDSIETMEIITISGSTDNWTLYASNLDKGYLYAAGANSNNYLRTKNDSTTWSISFSNGTPTLVSSAATRGTMQFNNASDQQKFACYETASQTVVCLWKEYVDSGLEDKQITFTHNEATVSTASVVLGTLSNTTYNITGLNVSGYSIESSNTSVATVSGTTITAVANGSATITISKSDDATYHYLPATIEVSVETPEPSMVTGQDLSDLFADVSGNDKVKYEVTGVVTEWKTGTDGTEYGNFYVQEEGNTSVSYYIYGATATSSALQWSANQGAYVFTNPRDFLTNPTTSGIEIGDILTMQLTRCDYQSTPEAHGIITNVEKGTTPEIPEPSMVTGQDLSDLFADVSGNDKVKYEVTGVVSAWKDGETDGTQYGNFYLQEQGNTSVSYYIYGATATSAALAWDTASGKYVFTNPRDFLTDPTTSAIVVGDVLTMQLTRCDYQSTPEAHGIITNVSHSATTYTISYDNNGGSGSMSDTTGAAPTVAACTFTAPEGKEFDRWNSSADGTGTDYAVGATVSQNITLYAIWDTPAADPTVYFTKITASSQISDGKYAIAYGDLMFDGSLATLDAAQNIKSMELANLLTSYFTISDGDIVSASGKYIGRTADSNGLNQSDTDDYTNTVSIDGDENLVVTSSAGAILRYNKTSGQERFRFFKSSTASGQQAIQLYRVNFDKVFEDAITCNESAGTHTFNMGIVWKDDGTGSNLSLENLYNCLSAADKENLSSSTLSKYDYIVGKYYVAQHLSSYNDFMGRNPSAVRNSSLLLTTAIGKNTNTITVIVIISLVSVTAIGGYFFIRRRKVQ